MTGPAEWISDFAESETDKAFLSAGAEPTLVLSENKSFVWFQRACEVLRLTLLEAATIGLRHPHIVHRVAWDARELRGFMPWHGVAN
jgi:hypothetical protein